MINGEDEVLAGWSDFGGLLVDGLKAFVVSLIFSIPLFLIWLPYGAIVALVGSTNGDTVGGIIGTISLCFGCLSLLYSIALLFFIPASYGRLAATGEIGDALNVGELWRMVSQNAGAYLIVLLGYIVAGFIASLGIIFCVIGVFFTSAYAVAVQGHLFGQAYNVSSAEA